MTVDSVTGTIPERVIAYLYGAGFTADEAEEALERFAGVFDDRESWASEFLEDTGALSDLPTNLQYYFDYSAYARDCEIGGDVEFVDDGPDLYVFHRS